MAQEFTIKSQDIEDKINQLLPSQGGFQPGVDFSASTMVVPIVDLTETAEGSALRQDLQTSFSLTGITAFSVTNTTTTIINTTGYFRVYGVVSLIQDSPTAPFVKIQLTDGFTTKDIVNVTTQAAIAASAFQVVNQDFIVKIEAGESLVVQSNDLRAGFTGNTRQIADINGNLVNP